MDNLNDTTPEDSAEQPGEPNPHEPLENATKTNPQTNREPLERIFKQHHLGIIVPDLLPLILENLNWIYK